MPVARVNDSMDLRSLPPAAVIFGESPIMAATRETLSRVSNTNIPVLLQGESGTGKEILAKFLHGHSDRSLRPWIKVSCPAIPSPLLESELFGYEKGAFTGAYATKQGRVEMSHLGTLFLDEVGSLDLSVQSKLLQLLQDGQFTRVGGHQTRRVDARLICAATGDLKQQAKEGGFRLDLLFRINAVTIELPPLRERTRDIPILVDYFLDLYSRAYRTNPKPLSRELMNRLSRHRWPGNIRELENSIRGYVLVGNEENLATELSSSRPTMPSLEIDLARPVSLKEIIKTARQDMERAIILKVLQANGWNRQKTAKWLKISYRSLLYKLQDLERNSISRNLWSQSTLPRPRPRSAEPSEVFESGDCEIPQLPTERLN